MIPFLTFNLRGGSNVTPLPLIPKRPHLPSIAFPTTIGGNGDLQGRKSLKAFEAHLKTFLSVDELLAWFAFIVSWLLVTTFMIIFFQTNQQSMTELAKPNKVMQKGVT